jgi:uncharacterized protein (TIGR02444 family)
MDSQASGPLRREPNAFWRYSLAAYRLPGVEAACLALQDRWATDTNLLLYCCWLAGTGRALDKRMLRRVMATVEHGQSELILPLRRVRRALKAASGKQPPGWAADLRKRIGAVELDLEYLEQQALAQFAQRLPPVTRQQPPRAAARASIDRYLALLGVPPAALERRRTQAMLEACFPSPPARGSG